MGANIKKVSIYTLCVSAHVRAQACVSECMYLCMQSKNITFYLVKSVDIGSHRIRARIAQYE